MATTAPIVRLATKEDVSEILAMIKELAGFENAVHEVKATEESLASTLTFAPCASDPHPEPKYAKTLLLTFSAPEDPSKEEIGGMALFFYNYSTWTGAPGVYLEDLFVRPRFRRAGHATLLLQKLAEESSKVSGGKGRLEWWCLKWNEGALKFYDGIGAVRQDEWVTLRVQGDALKALASRQA